MWRVGLFDLVHRRRRFVLAVLAASLAFGLSLLMTGIVQHLRNETDRIIALFEADQFVVAADGTGPFTTTRLLPASTADAIAAGGGVERADPFIQARDELKGKDVNVLGVVPGGLGAPPVADGRPLAASGEVITDDTLGYDPGDQITLADRTVTVAGVSHNTTYYFGQPTVFLPLEDAQEAYLYGQPLATAVAVRGTVATPPEGTQVLDPRATHDDLNRPQKSGTQTVTIINSLLWLMAAVIVASMVYLTALERSRDIAVFKAMGTSNARLYADMAVQGLVLALAACIVGAFVALGLARVMPFGVEIPGAAYVQLAVVGIVVGLIAAFIGLRRAVHIDPALAFGRT
jgi:putative ABC transport system permease protein